MNSAIQYIVYDLEGKAISKELEAKIEKAIHDTTKKERLAITVVRDA